eukprot:TRINITY_DN33090_c0_g1_i1.p1 TRINITY_DN33090_c0_g1~~TRINITY_DN33090_c0_g1_i1.p1  ORF type:complete len:535 (-),score=109.11 TRINITY_DN33090_c0_g1_i1:115-1719(-)
MSDGFVTVAQCVEGLPLGRCVLEVLLCGFFAWFLLGGINECTPFAFSLLGTPWESSQENVMALSAAMATGNFLAIAISGFVADIYGRLSVVRSTLVLTLAAGIALQTANNLTQALIARFILGLVSGGLLTVMPALIAELLPSRHRGFYLTVWCCGWPAGALSSLLLGCAFPGIGWREFYTMLILPALFLYVNTRLDMLPESPRYLYMAGRRDEGYEVLLDMYEKEEVLMPWAPESVSVTSSASTSPALPGWGASGGKEKQGYSASFVVTAWLAFTMFLASAAAQSVKLWMPTMLVASGADEGSAAKAAAFVEAVNLPGIPPLSLLYFAAGPKAVNLLKVVRAPLMSSTPDYGAIRLLAEAYAVEFVGIIACAYMAMRVPRKHLVRWPLFVAAGLTVLNLVPATGRLQAFMYGPLIGLQLTAQATAINFLQVFASEYFPTQRRARTVAVATFAAQLGSLVVPVVGGFVVRDVSAAAAMLFFALLYVLAWGVSFRLPLPSGRERPLFDVEEETRRTRGDAAASRRKRDWPSYNSTL